MTPRKVRKAPTKAAPQPTHLTIPLTPHEAAEWRALCAGIGLEPEHFARMALAAVLDVFTEDPGVTLPLMFEKVQPA